MKKFLGVLIFLFVVITMLVSNPSKSEYIEWASEKLMGTNDNLFSKIGSAIASPIISEVTTSDNFLIFTLYKTTNIDGSVYKTIGIYRNFIFMNKTDGNINLSNNSELNNNSKNSSSVDINSLIEDASNKVNDFIDSTNKALSDTLTSQPVQSIIENDDEFDVGGTITEGAVYNNYINGRYGFSIDYPNQFDIGVPPANGDGLRFISKDGKSILIAAGRNNVMDENAKDLYEAELADIKEVTYKFFKDNWYVLSWVVNGTVFYTRVIVGTGSINSFWFTCPEEHLDQYYEMIEHVSKSFEKGNIEISN